MEEWRERKDGGKVGIEGDEEVKAGGKEKIEEKEGRMAVGENGGV